MGDIESRIEHVTVYASGARIRRAATVGGPLPPRVRFVGLPVTVIDDTVRARVEGTSVVIALRVGTDAPAGEPAPEEPSELRAARRRVMVVESELARLASALEQLSSTPVIEGVSSDAPPAAWSAIVDARRTLVAARGARELELRERHAATKRELDEARQALEVAAARDRMAGSSRSARLHEVRKHVDVELAPGTGETIYLEYQVASARWAPSYVARLDGSDVRFELRAIVAQSSGEDWTGVTLALSTAEPDLFAQLPELAPQKIGRRQAEPARRGFRPPPSGAEQLYADFDRGFPRRRARRITGADVFGESTYEGRMPVPESPPPAEVWDEGSSRAKDQYQARPETAAKSRGGGLLGAIAGRASLAAPAGPAQTTRAEPAPPPPPVPRLDYSNLRMAPMRAPDRGRLVAAPSGDGDLVLRIAARTAAIAQLALPSGFVTDWVHAYDYAFAADGTVDIKSDASWSSIALTARPTTAKLHHVAVPREQADVFRLAEIANPFDGPLLPGPIDVYDRGHFLVTSTVDDTPPGATVEVGLGVDAAVKIARNVEFHEEATGVLRGALRLVHAIAIEIENASQRAVDVEVRECVPVTRDGDDEIEVAVARVEPAWERWTPDPDAPREARLRGAYRWRVAVPPSTKKMLRASYEVRIPSKTELVGGNRRES